MDSEELLLPVYRKRPSLEERRPETVGLDEAAKRRIVAQDRRHGRLLSPDLFTICGPQQDICTQRRHSADDGGGASSISGDKLAFNSDSMQGGGSAEEFVWHASRRGGGVAPPATMGASNKRVPDVVGQTPLPWEQQNSASGTR